MVVAGLSVVWASAYNTPSIQATLISQEPDPVEPGEILTLRFKIENEGMESSQDAIIKLGLKYPFTIYGDKAEKNIGKLQASSTGADAVIVEFKVKVDEQAVEGATPVDLYVQQGETSTAYTNNEFEINIRSRNALLSITSIASEPEQIAPGEAATIDIALKNNAKSLFREIHFRLDLSSSTLPLAPYQSSSEQSIPQLASNYQQSFQFKLIAEPDAASGLYKVPVTLSYYDEFGTAYTVSDVLAVIIGEKPKMQVYLKKSTVMQDNTAGKITLEVANAGNTDMKYVELTLNPSSDYQLVTTRNYFYLGNVNSDDTQSEEIDVYLTPEEDIVNIPGILKYVDANNKAYQQEFNLELNIYSSSQLRKFGLVQGSSGWAYILLIIIAVGGFFGYRYWKKKKSNGKK